METVGAACPERLAWQAVEGRRFFACGYEGGAKRPISVTQGQVLIRGRGCQRRKRIRVVGDMGSMLSDAAIPCRFAAAVLDKVVGRYQQLQMLFHRVAVRAG